MKQIFFLIAGIFLVSLVYEPYSVHAQSYLDLSIDQAITIALKNNRDIKNANEEKVRANLRVTEAASGAFPQINGSWSLEKNLKPMIFVISIPDSTGKLRKNRLKVGADHTVSLGANITQPIYVGGKIGTALKAARIYRQFSSENLNTVKQNVVMGAATAYNRILLAKEMVKITGASLEQARKHLGNVEKLYKNGRATEYDLLRSRVNVANLKPGLMEAGNNVKISLLYFKEFLGLSQNTPLTIKGKLTEPDTSLFKLANPENAYAFTFRMEGHAFYVFTFPDEGTFVFDASTGRWCEWQTFGFDDWSAIGFSNAYNKRLIGDRRSNKIFEIGIDFLDDAGGTIRWEATSPPIASPNNELTRHNMIRIDIESGVGLESGQGINPQIWLEWSNEDGSRYENKHLLDIGKVGDTKKRVFKRRLGIARSRTYRISGSDPVKIAILGAYIDVQGGRW